MPTTKNPTAFTHKKDFAFSMELFPHFIAGNFAVTPIENFYIHGEFANFSEGTFSHYNNISSFGLGAYKLIDSTHQVEFQASMGSASFDYGDPLDGSDYNLTLANGNSKIYSCFLSYNIINPKNQYGFVVNVGSVNVHYQNCNLSNLEGSTQNAFNISYFFISKFRLANHVKLFFEPGVNYLYNTTNRIRYNSFSFRFGIELKLK